MKGRSSYLLSLTPQQSFVWTMITRTWGDSRSDSRIWLGRKAVAAATALQVSFRW
jgi:hypothetical protein